MTSVRRNTSAIWLSAVVTAGAALFPRAALAQTYEGEAPPPPPDDEGAQPGAPPADALPPAQAPGPDTFQQSLSPYGRWIDTPEYGRVWVPYESDPDWQPYTDGYWVDTAWGWSFASTVPWGWATFHYGRWGYGLGLGWFWVPGFVWSPAWVSWRYSPGFVCWSPFAPAGFVYGRHWPGWVTVAGIHFTHPINRFRIPLAHSVGIVRAATPVRAISSRIAVAHSPANWRNPGVRSGARPNGGGRPAVNVPARANRGFTRNAFQGGAVYRGTINRGGFAWRGNSSASTTRSFFARPAAPARSWSFNGGRAQIARAPVMSRGGGAARRR
jgi:hypothetical protein